MEKMQIMGHIGKDAVTREVNGKKAVNFNVAVNSSYKQTDGTKIEKTNWYNCTKWLSNSQSDGIVQYLTKGKFIVVEGKLNAKMYKDKNNATQIDLGLIVSEIHLTPDATKVEKEENVNTNETEIDMPF